jgi:excisionase family DNA binding protein
METTLPSMGVGSNEKKATPLFENKNRKYLTTEEVAEYLRISVRTIYDWKHQPSRYRIPSGMFFKIGKRILIDNDIFMNWITTRR